MKKFIGGLVFGALVYPVLSYCASIAETAANLVVTKLSVIMAADAAKLESDGTVAHAIGFCAPDDPEEDEEEDF
jgi:hypothetical protein